MELFLYRSLREDFISTSGRQNRPRIYKQITAILTHRVAVYVYTLPFLGRCLKIALRSLITNLCAWIIHIKIFKRHCSMMKTLLTLIFRVVICAEPGFPAPILQVLI